MNIVCGCRKGYASEVDGMCRFCREHTVSRAEGKNLGVKHRGDGMTTEQKNNQTYKAYNQLLSARDSEFRLKPNGDKLTLITTAKILIKRDVPIDTLPMFIEGLLIEEFGIPVTTKVKDSYKGPRYESSNSGGDFATGLILGSMVLGDFDCDC